METEVTASTPAAAPAGGPETVATVVARHLAADDGSEFLRLILPGSEDAVLSYRELVGEATRWTALYRERGLVPGDRVIVTLRHSVDLYAAYTGALLAGLVPSMFSFPSPKFSEDEYFRTLGALLRSANARLFVTYEELAAAMARRGEEATVVTAPAPEADGWTGLPGLDPDATAFLQYSSGTTGLKKGVAVSHRALIWQVEEYGRAIGASERDRIVSWLPLYHDMGLIACFFLPLLLKVPTVAMSPFDWVARPRMWLEAATEHRATLAWLPNFAYAFMAASVSDDDLDGLDLSSLRGVVNCSEPLMASSQDAFAGRFAACGFSPEALAASYAMAENTFAVTSGGFAGPPVTDWIDGQTFDHERRAVPAEPGAQGARPLVSSGRALPDTDVIAVDAERRPLGERELGELAVRSPGLMSGYDNNAEETAAAMSDGLFYTGDLGYVAGGEVYVTGRRKDLVIIGGRNIYPQDIEDAVLAVDGVVAGRAVAFGIPDPRHGTEQLVVLAESEQPEDAWPDLRRAIHHALAERADVVPGDVEIVAPRTLVKSSSGKLARGENRARYLERREEAAPAAAAPKATGRRRARDGPRLRAGGRPRAGRRPGRHRGHDAARSRRDSSTPSAPASCSPRSRTRPACASAPTRWRARRWTPSTTSSRWSRPWPRAAAAARPVEPPLDPATIPMTYDAREARAQLAVGSHAPGPPAHAREGRARRTRPAGVGAADDRDRRQRADRDRPQRDAHAGRAPQGARERPHRPARRREARHDGAPGRGQRRDDRARRERRARPRHGRQRRPRRAHRPRHADVAELHDQRVGPRDRQGRARS